MITDTSQPCLLADAAARHNCPRNYTLEVGNYLLFDILKIGCQILRISKQLYYGHFGYTHTHTTHTHTHACTHMYLVIAK